MSIGAPAKRQRTNDASAKPGQKSPLGRLSAGQQRSLRHAQYLENGVSVSDRLASLRAGTSDLGQIAWSSQNVLATASNTHASASTTTAGGHVIVQYPVSSTSKRSLRPSYLYPEHPTFAAAPAAGPSQLRPGTAAFHQGQATRYEDPKHISFSPCGYYLCAYFPVPDQTARSKKDASPASPETGTNGIGSGALPTQALDAQGIPPLNGSTLPADPSHPLQQESSAAGASKQPTDGKIARLCIWSRAETGALNDWKLVQSFPVQPTCSANQAATSATSDNVLKVNEKGQQIPRDGGRSSPSAKELAYHAGCLRGGVKQVVWLSRRRRVVLSSSSSSSSHYGATPFTRLATRGPSFLPAASALANDAGSDHDIALMVFGHYGQVSLLSSRQADREAAFNASSNSNADAAEPRFFSTILHSSLYTPNLQPSPITLDSAASLGERQPNTDAPYASPFSASKLEGQAHELDQYARITHLAVGMPANDSTLLVASKRLSSASSLIDLAEISVDLRAEPITMITRPLQPVSLSSFDLVQSGEMYEDGTAHGETEGDATGLDNLSILTWAEVDFPDAADADKAGRSASLQLIACASRLGAPSREPDSQNKSSALISMGTCVAVWDVRKAENDLSDAFASLECKKTGHAPKWLDWQLRFAYSKRLSGMLVTSLVTNAFGLAMSDVAILTNLVPAADKPGLVVEQLSYFDLRHGDVAEAKSSVVPMRALSRSSFPVVSANGALVATFSSSFPGASHKSIVIWRLPEYPSAPPPQQPSEATPSDPSRPDAARTRMSQMLALSCLRKSDTSDISRAFGAAAKGKTGGNLLIEIGDLLKITDSKRQDVLVKIEGATQKGPSHDTNSIPFHHALRLLKIRMAMGDQQPSQRSDAKSAVRLERLVLELGLCYQVLRLARITTEVTVTPAPPAADSKKKSQTAAKNTAVSESRTRVYYRLESVWPLLAQLQWFLTLLDGISKLALATSASDDASKHAMNGAAAHPTTAGKDTFEQDFVRMLNKPTPRRLVLQIVAHFCDFQEWISSTTKKENLPPATGASVGDEAMAFFASSGEVGADGRVLAVSEQMSLARDALRLVAGDASMHLADFARVLVKIEAESANAGVSTGPGPNQNRQANRFWWATLAGQLDPTGTDGNVKSEQEAAGMQAKLLSSIVEPASGVLVDVLTLFVSPSDISDERSVLYDKCIQDEPLVAKNGNGSKQEVSSLVKALSAMSAKRSGDDMQRDIVRKVSLRNTVTQTAILNDAATLLRNNPTTASALQRLQPPFQPNVSGAGPNDDAEAEGNLVKLPVMRAKQCVRCGSLSQDSITAVYSISPPSPVPGNGMMVDPSLPPQVQMQVQMQMQMAQMQYQMQQHQQQQQAMGPVLTGGMPFMPMPMMQPQPKLVSIEAAAQTGAGAAFKYNCLCGGSWWVL